LVPDRCLIVAGFRRGRPNGQARGSFIFFGRLVNSRGSTIAFIGVLIRENGAALFLPTPSRILVTVSPKIGNFPYDQREAEVTKNAKPPCVEN
jgi:hypothetical protein